MNTVPHFKRVWKTLTGKVDDATAKSIQEILDHTRDYISKGVIKYNSFNKESYKQCLEKVKILKKSDFADLIYYLSESLNLDTGILWAIFCNYLMFEFFGKIEDFDKILYTISAETFMLDLWQFYAIERSFLMKITAYILEEHRNTSHKYYKIYQEFVEKLSYKELQANQIKQFEVLIKELHKLSPSSLEMKYWVERNLAEQLHTVQLILTSIQYRSLTMDELIKFLKLCKKNNFKRLKSTIKSVLLLKSNVIQSIINVQTAVIIISLNSLRNTYSDWQRSILELDQLLSDLQNRTLLFSWSLILISSPTQIVCDKAFDELLKLFKSNIFGQVYQLVIYPIFKNSVSGQFLRKAIFQQLNILYEKHPYNGIFEEPMCIPLFAELLCTHELAALCFAGSYEGIKQLYLYAMSLFPHNFKYLSQIMKSLISLKQDTPCIINELKSLQVYSVAIDPLKPIFIKNGYLTRVYKPFNNDLVVFPIGTKVDIVESDTTLHKFNGTYDYFKVMEQVVGVYMSEIDINLSSNSNTINIITACYELILEILKADWQIVCANPEIEQLLNIVPSYLISQHMKTTVKDMLFLKLCVEISVDLFKYVPERVLNDLTTIKFLPKVATNNYTVNVFTNYQLITHFLLLDLIEEEYKKLESCDFLILYLQLIKECAKNCSFIREIQFPGLMYIFLKVFPCVIGETYGNQKNRQTLLADMLEILYYTLRKNPFILTDVHEIALYDACAKLFSTNRLYVTSILNIVCCGSDKLKLLMAYEVNWKSNYVIEFASITKNALYCLLYILKYIQSGRSTDKHEYLESQLISVIKDESTALKIISGYMNTYHDPDVASTACEILAVFASISQRPLLHALKLDSFQVQGMFLERLRDSMESEQVQMGILKLIAGCIEKQTGMTLAFFSEDNLDNNIFCFLDEFMTKIENTDLLNSPLQQQVLDLFHVLWIKNKMHMVQKIIEKDNFWTSFAFPLYKISVVNVEVVLKIFEILTIELYNNESECKQFTKCLTLLFDDSSKFLDIWTKYLIEMIYNETLVKKDSFHVLSVSLKIWKKFINAVKYVYKNRFDEQWRKAYLSNKCLRILLAYSDRPKDLETLIDSIELCVLFPNTVISKKNVNEVQPITWLSDILHNLSYSYSFLNARCKVSLLSVTVQHLRNYIKNLSDPEHLLECFLQTLLKYFIYEYSLVMDIKDYSQEDLYFSWFLILTILNMFINEGYVTEKQENLFIDCGYFNKLTDVLTMCIVYPISSRIADITASSLVNFAKSNLKNHLTYLDLSVIYKETTSPKYSLISTNDSTILKNYLIAFSCIVKLNGILLNKMKRQKVDSALKFIYVHQPILVDIFNLAAVTSDISHLRLVVNILHFLYDALGYKIQWNVEDRASLQLITTSIKEVLNVSIGAILRPKIVVFTLQKTSLPTQVDILQVPEREYIDIFDVFIEIITWSCMFFTRSNPPIAQLFDFTRPSGFTVFVEQDFRVPPAIIEEPKVLTYGSLLCVLRFFCRTLIEMSLRENEKEVAMSATPKIVPQESFDVKNTNSTSSDFNISIIPTNAKETPETINALYRFDTTETSTLPAPWFVSLNSDNLWIGVESIISFLAVQSFLTVHDSRLDRTIMRYIKRELCAELGSFYDLVDKIVIEKYITKLSKPFGKPESLSANRLYKNQQTPCKLVINRKPEPLVISDLDDCYFLTMVQWFRCVCGLVHNSKFDEFLSNWHAKSTWVNQHSTFVKNTSVNLSESEDDDEE